MTIIVSGFLVVAGLLAGCAGSRRPSTAAPSDPGMRAFQAYCAACHVINGSVASVEAPPLDGSTWAAGPKDRLIRIVLEGLRGPVAVGGKTFNQEMPAVGKTMTDEQVAAVLSFVRRRYGAASQPILPADVGRVRAADRNRASYWTVEELMKEP
jgi:mono/diheme cytochrome c family protein